MANETAHVHVHEPAPIDVVVVGGGPAGLAGALMLGRSRRSVVVVDAGEPRNAPSAHAHGLLFREGTSPAELLAIGRQEVRAYGVEVLDGRASGATKEADGTFTVTLEDGRRLHARRLLVATGLVDELPPIPGVAERWGHDVLHCPYCHGWEVRDQAIVVLGTNGMGAHGALLFRQLSADVTLVIHGGPELTAEERDQLAARGVRIAEAAVRELVVEDDRLTGVRLESAEVIAAQAVVVAPGFRTRSDVLDSLGLERVEGPFGLGTVYPADPMGATAIEGLYLAGNVAEVQLQVLHAAAAGSKAGAMINFGMVAEEAAHAVDAAGIWSQPTAPVMDEAFWDQNYRRRPMVWSGNPNPALVADAADLAPGAALDLGAGEGGDAIWLAECGWTVTAVDVSAVALERGRDQAEARGSSVAGRITWVHADVAGWQPPKGEAFALVTSQFVHLPMGDREQLFGRAAAAVAPGGTLLIVGHHPDDIHAGVGRPNWPELFFTADDVAATLDERWTIVTAERRPRPATTQDGEPVTVHDAVLVARRSR